MTIVLPEWGINMDNSPGAAPGISFLSIAGGKNGVRLRLFAMALPLFALVIVFNYLPLWGWAMAFIKYRPGVSIFQSEFVGFSFFTKIFEPGSNFLQVFRNTLVLGLLSQLGTPIAVVFALMLNESRLTGFKKVIQTVTSLPNFISMIIVYSIFFRFLSVEDGIVNVMLRNIGLLKQPIDFLASKEMVWPLQTFVGIWKYTGWTAIIFISAIAGIEQELYEAASVDGAGRAARMWNITLPGIMPTFAVMMILNIGYLLSTGFEQYYLFYNGMIASHIEVLDTYVYRLGIAQGNYSYATAIGVSKTLISVFLLFMANLVSKRTTRSSFF